MPTQKELLNQTVKAAAELIKGGKDMKRIKETIRRQMAEERAVESSTTSGETEPDE